MARQSRLAVYVLEAGTLRSRPAPMGTTTSAARPSREARSLTIAKAGRLCRRASSTTAATSGEAPDWLIASTANPSRRGGLP